MVHNYTSSINLIVIDRIEKDLKSYDLRSMVFLLYDQPQAAFSVVLLLEQEQEARGLLRTWAEDTNRQPTWKEEFIEALYICKLYNIIEKLGLNLKRVKRCLDEACHVDTMKRVLYRLCEHMTSDYLDKLKKALLTYGIDVMECKSCALVLLKLMRDSFITVNRARDGRECEYKIEILIKIIEPIQGLKSIAEELCDTRKTFCGTNTDTSIAITYDNNEPTIEKYSVNDFRDIFNMMEAISVDISFDSNDYREDMYPIINPQKVGTCYIINEEKFFLPADRIDNCTSQVLYNDRLGSSKDKERLGATMSSLNFKVYNSDDLDHEQLNNHIRYVLQNKVEQDDSIFMLCILSHGVNGCIISADCEEVEIEQIQNLIGEELYKRSIDIPKVMIIQACQGDDSPSHIPEEHHKLLSELQHGGATVAKLRRDTVSSLVSDSPIGKAKKADFLICKATSSKLNAYRALKRIEGITECFGSIFIQALCENIQKYSNSKHLSDIMVKVNSQMADFFKSLQYDQYSMTENSLTKDLYLQIPNNTK